MTNDSSSKFDQQIIKFAMFLRRRRYIQKPRVSDALRRATLGEARGRFPMTLIVRPLQGRAAWRILQPRVALR